MSRQQILYEILSKELTPTHLEIKDETHMHNVPKNSESHFKVIMVANCFERLSRIERHRRVNQLLQQEFLKGMHALSLHLYSHKEWDKKQHAPDSPNCKGGSRHEI